MQVSPVELHDLVSYLRSSGLQTEELREKLKKTVSEYRLDRIISTGRNSTFRRTYTCTFFNHGELGCPLPREVKPYGCLAFNNHDNNLKASSGCYSEKELLEIDDAELNEKVKAAWGLYWDKLPLPVALLEVWDKDLIDDGLQSN